MAYKLQEELIASLLDSNIDQEDKNILVSFWIHINVFPDDFKAARRNAKIQCRENEFETGIFDLDFSKETVKNLEIEQNNKKINVFRNKVSIFDPKVISSSFLERTSEGKVELIKQYLPLALVDRIGFTIPDNVYRCLINKYGASLEVFSNPINPRLKDNIFLFDWTEDGNIGLGGKCSIINPPHNVHTIIDGLNEQIEKALEKKGTCIFLFLPDIDLTSINHIIDECQLMIKKDEIILLVFFNDYDPWDCLGSKPLTSCIFY
jgi:hypothetical protein